MIVNNKTFIIEILKPAKVKKIQQIAWVIILLVSILVSNCNAQTERPSMWGIAKMTFLVSDYQLARDYYGEFLGLDEAFSYPTPIGDAISFKVNDRQFLEFIEDKNAKEKTRLVSLSFETENVEQMRKYLSEKGIKTPDKTTIDGAGNEIILIHDPSGVQIEFLKFGANSSHKQSKGKFLSDQRIGNRIHHAGIYTKSIEANNSFYVDILGFTEFWRYTNNKTGESNFIYMRMPDCVENIEYFISDDTNVSHPCFLVEDMQETIYTLKEKQGKNKLAKPVIGGGKRWLLNIKNEDETKVEFTEAHTVY